MCTCSLTTFTSAAEGWRGNINCVIKLFGSSDITDPDPEESSIFAFNFISGFLCLVIPTIFLLLLIYSISKDFKKDLFDKSIVRKVLITVIVAYIAFCILIGLAQLGLSIYVATLIYPIYQTYLNAPPPVNMTMPATEPGTIAPGVIKFSCDSIVYLSAFISLTMTYILVFILLAISVGLFITAKVTANSIFHYFNIVVDGYFVACLNKFRKGCGPGATSASAAGSRRNTVTSTRTPLILEEHIDESAL